MTHEVFFFLPGVYSLRTMCILFQGRIEITRKWGLILWRAIIGNKSDHESDFTHMTLFAANNTLWIGVEKREYSPCCPELAMVKMFAPIAALVAHGFTEIHLIKNNASRLDVHPNILCTALGCWFRYMAKCQPVHILCPTMRIGTVEKALPQLPPRPHFKSFAFFCEGAHTHTHKVKPHFVKNGNVCKCS